MRPSITSSNRNSAESFQTARDGGDSFATARDDTGGSFMTAKGRDSFMSCDDGFDGGNYGEVKIERRKTGGGTVK